MVSLRNLNPIDPLQLLEGRMGPWIRVTIYCALFIAMTNAVFAFLPHFKDNQHAKKLAFFLGLILGVGLFYAEKIMHFRLESFAFMSVWFIIILFGLVAFGLFRTGMPSKSAFAVAYVVIFLSFVIITPTMYDSMNDAIPWAVVILWLFFVISIFLIMGAFFQKTVGSLSSKLPGLGSGPFPRFSRNRSEIPKKMANDISNTQFLNEDDTEIDKEIDEDNKELQNIKHFTGPITKKEIKTVDDIRKYLDDMIQTTKSKGSNLTNDDKANLTRDLRAISNKESILRVGLDRIKQHANAYKGIHRKDIPQLQKRLSHAKSLKTQHLVGEEISYQKYMLEALKFLEEHESKILEFSQSFNRLIFEALNKLKGQNPSECLRFLEHAKESLHRMRHVYKNQKELEDYLIHTDKKTIADLKKEKKAKGR